LAQFNVADLLDGVTALGRQNLAYLFAGIRVFEQETTDIAAVLVLHKQIESRFSRLLIRMAYGLDVFEDAHFAARMLIVARSRPHPNRRPALLASIEHKRVLSHAPWLSTRSGNLSIGDLNGAVREATGKGQ
jgi:hypothetical protein